MIKLYPPGHSLTDTSAASTAETTMGVPEVFNHALACHQAGNLSEAERLYQLILGLDARQFQVIQLLGVIAYQQGRNEEAVACYDRALAIKPDFTDALSNRGLALQNLKRFEDALGSYDKALLLKSDYAEALFNRGNVLQELRRFEDALASYDKALAIKADYVKALSNRGAALRNLKRYQDALTSCDKALTIQAESADALCNRGATLQDMGRHAEALASYDKALAIQPGHTMTLTNRGATLRDLGRYEEALASYDSALAIQPDYIDALCNRGITLQDMGRCEEALASYQNVLAFKPDYAEAHANEGLCRLLMGDFGLGWKKYEWRWRRASYAPLRREFHQPLWLGHESLAGKTILLHAEQGFGDAIQFVRYAKAVAEEGATVLLEVLAPLTSLLAGVDGVSRLLVNGESLPEFDCHCPLLSLPLAFNTRLETIPAAIPYLRAAPDLVEKWEGRLGQRSGPRVGLVWSGNPDHKNDRNRSIPLQKLMPLLSRGLQLISLQQEVKTEDRNILGNHKELMHFGAGLKDFSDTAALIQTMDLVVTVDTSVAHLAGAMGKTVWILLPFSPDWRWLIDREDSPWYPSARLFRQSRIGDWDGVISRVMTTLDDWGRHS